MTINSFSSYKPVDLGPLPLSQGDNLLCASGILSIALSLAEKMGHSASLPKEIVAYVPLALDLYALAGESLTSVGSALNGNESFDKVFAELPRLAIAAALTGAKSVLFNKMQDHPLLKPVLLVLNAYGTYSVVQRAFVQLNKCVELAKDPKKPKGTYTAIATNVLVHTFNASYSAYRTGSLLLACKSLFLGKTNQGLFLGKTNQELIDKILKLSEEKEASMKDRISEQVALRKEKGWFRVSEDQIRNALEAADQKELACEIFKPACKLEGKEQKKEVGKIYDTLSVKVHPDKNLDNRDRATKAFQILGQAKDFLSPRSLTVSETIDAIANGTLNCERLDPKMKGRIKANYGLAQEQLKECNDELKALEEEEWALKKAECDEKTELFERVKKAFNLCGNKASQSNSVKVFGFR